MVELTSKERFKRIFEHREADRIPIIDCPWASTIERWHREGMPTEVDYADYFGLDQVAVIYVDNSPGYESRVIEETEDYIIRSTEWGVTVRDWKHAASAPEFLDFTITGPDKWQEAKKRMMPCRERIDWTGLKADYRRWREKEAWIQAGLWFGFDVTHSWTVGTERLLMALVEDPEWCVEMFNTFLDVNLALLDMVWNEGYEFDAVYWPDDMGYKQKQFFSIAMYRELLKPVHKRAVDWAHAKGIKAHLHSCGDINPLIPELIDIGVDALNPLEVKAGMNPVQIKEDYGDKLVLHGGINAVLWENIEALEVEMSRVVPVMKSSGGYIFSTDHSVPSNVSLEDFQRVVELVRKLGIY